MDETFLLSGRNGTVNVNSGKAGIRPIPVLIESCSVAGDDILDATYWRMSSSKLGHYGNDTIKAGSAGGMLYGGEGDDTLVGSDQIDLLYGDAGNDTLRALMVMTCSMVAPGTMS